MGTSGTTQHVGVQIAGISGTADDNYGIAIAPVSGATNNYGLFYDGPGATDFVVMGDGRVGIGTKTPNASAMLDVNGAIYQRGSSLHADYVFQDDYELESIEDHSEFMWSNSHLPAVPAVEYDEDGQEILELGSHRQGMLEELEKAHVYIEQLNDSLNSINVENNLLKDLVCLDHAEHELCR